MGIDKSEVVSDKKALEYLAKIRETLENPDIAPVVDNTVKKSADTLSLQKNKPQSTNVEHKEKCEIADFTIHSYEVLNEKIYSLVFSHGKHKYRLYLENYSSKISQYKNYQNTDAIPYTVVKIDDLQLGKIQKKVKSGYGELKKKVNYFAHEGLNYYQVKSMVGEFLKNYHKR